MSTFKPMKGEKPDPKYPLRFPLYASIKYDGIRLAMDGDNPRTAQNKDLPNLHTVKMLQDNALLQDLDMELIVGDPADPLCYNKTYRAVMTITGEPKVDFYIFDIIDLTLTFEERLKILEELKPYLPDNCKVVEQILVHNQAELDALYDKVTAQGHEGLILKLPSGRYKMGRGTAKEQLLLKLKPEEDFEFEVVGCYEAMENTNTAFQNELGRTDRSTDAAGLVPKNTLGGFYAKALTNGESKSFPVGVSFKCAPGKLTHDERQRLWELYLSKPSEVVGMIGKCRHFPVGVLDLPRHGRWIGWRSRLDMDAEDEA